MTENEASQIIQSMKENEFRFTEEDWDDSLIYRWNYDVLKDKFIFQRLDTIVGYMFPDAEFDEEHFKKFLIEYFEYSFFIKHLYK